MDARLLFPNEYLGAADLREKDVVLTVSRLAMEELRTEKGHEDKWVIYFAEMEERHKRDKKKLNKRLVLNRTNAKSIAKVLGNETNAWIGKTITLFPTTCLAFGKEVDCIRVREKAPRGKAALPPTDEPNPDGPEPPQGALESDQQQG